MKIRRIFSIHMIAVYVAIIIIAHCFIPINPVGTYILKNTKNTFDTLQLYENGRYSQRIYSKNKILLFSNTGNWTCTDNRLDIENFFPNDDHYLTEKYDFESVLIGYSVELERIFFQVQIEYAEESEPYKYVKKLTLP